MVGLGVAVAPLSHNGKRFFVRLPVLPQLIQRLPLLLRLGFAATLTVGKGDLFCLFHKHLPQTLQILRIAQRLNFCLGGSQMLFHALAPAETVPPGSAFYLGPVNENCLMVSFFLSLQKIYILVEQIFYSLCTSSCPEP